MNSTRKTILTIVITIVVIAATAWFAVIHWFIGKGREIVEEAKNEETTTEAVAVTTEENDVINVDFVGTGAVVAVRNDNNGTDAVENENTADENAVEITTNNTTVITTANTTAETTKPAVTTEAPETTEAPVVQACQHNWKTVVDTEAYDEPVYEEKEIWKQTSVWSDGTVCDHAWSSGERNAWCAQHCVTCYPNCPDPDPQGRCAIYDNFTTTVCVGTEKVQTGTKHHDAVTHQECTKCGAVK